MQNFGVGTYFNPLKRQILTLCLALASLVPLRAQTFIKWQDQTVNERNRMRMHTSFFAYKDAASALTADKRQSERFLSIDGTWKFFGVEHADERPRDFFRPTYDDSAWGTMPIPGIWELNGFGDPMHINIEYPWDTHFKNNPPYVPEYRNHVGSYRRVIKIPESWSGKQIIAHFGSVTSNLYLWVNGRFVGYSKDSKLATEFDLTPYLKLGKNLFVESSFDQFRKTLPCAPLLASNQPIRKRDPFTDITLQRHPTVASQILVHAEASFRRCSTAEENRYELYNFAIFIFFKNKTTPANRVALSS